MRYSVLHLALAGSAAVQAAVVPAKRDYTDDQVCKVETVTVKLTTLDHIVGHTFDLLTPEEAIANVVAAKKKEQDGGDGSPDAPALVPSLSLNTYNPKTTPEAGETSFSGFTTSQATGKTGGGYINPGDLIPTGIFPSGDSQATGTGGVDLPKPTGIYEIPDDFSSYISEALDQLTGGSTKYATKTDDSDSPSSSAGAGTSGASTTLPNSSVPFPTGSSNSTMTGTVISGTDSQPTGTDVSSTDAASSTEAASSTDAASSTEAASSTDAPSSTKASSTVASSTVSSSSTSASASATGCTNPKIRPEWREMSSASKKAYAEAIKCLMDAPSKGVSGATSRWEDLAALHQAQNTVIHGVGQFLPWHRYFIHVQETLLREECSYNGPIPWWDETKDAGAFQDSPVFESQYLGSARVMRNNLGACVTDGVFANLELNVGPGNRNQPHCLSRAVNNDLSKSVTSNFLAACNSHSTYADMLGCSYPGPHAYGHDATGGVMADVLSSPGDPVFFLHHGMVDRSWKLWQSQSNSHKMAIGGMTTQGGNVPTTLSYRLSSLGVIPDVTVEKVMDTEGDYLCYEYSY